jgi:hypothetical protein
MSYETHSTRLKKKLKLLMLGFSINNSVLSTQMDNIIIKKNFEFILNALLYIHYLKEIYKYAGTL